MRDLFEAEHQRFHDDWFVRMKRELIMTPTASESRMFQEWAIGHMAAMSAAIKRLMHEATKNHDTSGKIQGND